jgi:hypothetical protein
MRLWYKESMKTKLYVGVSVASIVALFSYAILVDLLEIKVPLYFSSTFNASMVLLTLFLHNRSCRFNEITKQPDGGMVMDKLLKVIHFNPFPVFCLLMIAETILFSFKNNLPIAAFFMASASLFFHSCDKRRGWSIFQVWYETTEGQVMVVRRW